MRPTWNETRGFTYRALFKSGACASVELVGRRAHVEDEHVTRMDGVLAETDLAHVRNFALLAEKQEARLVLLWFNFTETGRKSTLQRPFREQAK